MAKKPCVTHGCPALVPRGVTKCADCTAKADRDRGSSTDRGYGTEHRERFREGVLAMQPVCVVCWSARATVADHYPLSRRELVDAGEDPNDPKHGRGLCAPCHSRETARLQPGGWHISPDG